jgi:hypothetical protein
MISSTSLYKTSQNTLSANVYSTATYLDTEDILEPITAYLDTEDIRRFRKVNRATSKIKLPCIKDLYNFFSNNFDLMGSNFPNIIAHLSKKHLKNQDEVFLHNVTATKYFPFFPIQYLKKPLTDRYQRHLDRLTQKKIFNLKVEFNKKITEKLFNFPTILSFDQQDIAISKSKIILACEGSPGNWKFKWKGTLFHRDEMFKEVSQIFNEDFYRVGSEPCANVQFSLENVLKCFEKAKNELEKEAKELKISIAKEIYSHRKAALWATFDSAFSDNMPALKVFLKPPYLYKNIKVGIIKRITILMPGIAVGYMWQENPVKIMLTAALITVIILKVFQSHIAKWRLHSWEY